MQLRKQLGQLKKDLKIFHSHASLAVHKYTTCFIYLHSFLKSTSKSNKILWFNMEQRFNVTRRSRGTILPIESGEKKYITTPIEQKYVFNPREQRYILFLSSKGTFFQGAEVQPNPQGEEIPSHSQIKRFKHNPKV